MTPEKPKDKPGSDSSPRIEQHTLQRIDQRIEYVIDYTPRDEKLRAHLESLLAPYEPVYLRHVERASVMILPEQEQGLLAALSKTTGVVYRRGEPRKALNTVVSQHGIPEVASSSHQSPPQNVPPQNSIEHLTSPSILPSTPHTTHYQTPHNKGGNT
jgi:hypothetical protein